ncbi:hypothetical protein [Novosphingobium sp.]|uniref:hypothetical protein n=1 Tax=Novosphingobium sp. TaxID=1874826 RepID=UPI001ECB8B89|nr:hypothetical protein [Novosphingobium sp.]MBK9012413.1 hypothetical protein [Novosphingobium sp.]
MRHHGAGWLGGLLLALGAPTGALAQDLHGQDHAQHPAAPAAEAQDQQHRHDDAMVPRTATLLPGYGNGGFAVSTGNAEAQKFFANGLELHAAFAHRAAVAAMTEAVRLDPACAMCKWGLALTDGPTINYGKDAKERGPLLVLAREAQAGVRRSGTAKERALTDALVLRYAPGKDTARADDRYAAAMQAAAARFPDDNEILGLAADALMVSAFADDGSDYDHAAMQAAVVLLEKVLKRAPDHTPAIHFYIHATEVIGKPELAEAYADRLAGLAPRASHLVHMPSHTWYWVGRYQDAARTNRAAVELGKANARALGLPDPKGVWDLPYHAHNVIYGLGGALMAGDSRIALDLARPLVERSATDDKARPWSQLLAASGYFALARFDPASVGALPEPKLGYLKAAWHYARGESLVWAGDLTGARAEAAAIPLTLVQGKPERDAVAAEQMLGITRAVLEGRIAMAEARWKDAADLFRKAAEIEETEEFSDFSDPPAFWYPVRRDLAAALLAAGDAAGAQREAEASLRLRQLDPVAMQVLAAARTALDRDSPLVR